MVKISKNERGTRKIARDLALRVVKVKNPVTIALEGELGAGKTTFVKGFAKALGIKTKIKSPTFTLMKKYPVKLMGLSAYELTSLIHLDCYRVRDHRDLATLDLKSIFNSPENIVLIEWPERVSKILPKKLIRVHIDHLDKNKRKITISQ
ncbi:MAG: tRNA (adenosine(37)-N6)-threonylcarbamoyltransferase complex ATPase subunit type 1 TsaE [Patescibacteria group bacterium]